MNMKLNLCLLGSCLLAFMRATTQASPPPAAMDTPGTMLWHWPNLCPLCTGALTEAANELSDLADIVLAKAGKLCDGVCIDEKCTKDCNTFITDLYVQLVQQLANNETQRMICGMAHLCDTTDMQHTLYELMEEEYKEMNLDFCSICMWVFKEASRGFNDSMPQLLSWSDQACDQICLSDECKAACHAFAQQYWNDAERHLADEKWQRQMCQKAYLCPPSDQQMPTFNMGALHAAMNFHWPNVCPMCTGALMQAAQKLSDLSDIVLAKVDVVCTFVCIDDDCTQKCNKIIADAYAQLVMQLANNETEHMICGMMHLCQSQANLNLCSMCTGAIQCAADRLNRSAPHLLSMGDRMCDFFCRTDTCKTSCHEFIRQEVEGTLDKLADKDYQKAMCRYAGMCRSLKPEMASTFHKHMDVGKPTENADACDMCNRMVNIAYSALKAGLGKDQIKGMLLDACNKLGGQLAPTCRELVNQEFDQVMGWITQGTYPIDQICVQLKYC